MPKLRIEINREKCIGDKHCWNQAPETFEIDDEDKARVVDPDGNWFEYIMKAAQGCPTDSITLIDAESGETLWPKK